MLLNQLYNALRQLPILQNNRKYSRHFDARDVIMVAMCGSMCGLRDMSTIWGWSRQNVAFFQADFGIDGIPAYVHFTKLLTCADKASLERIVYNWLASFMPSGRVADMSVVKKQSYPLSENPIYKLNAYFDALEFSIQNLKADPLLSKQPNIAELIAQLDFDGSIVWEQYK